MISINQNPDGSVNISIESVQERMAMHQQYRSEDLVREDTSAVNGDLRSDETLKDIENERCFRSGFGTAVGLALVARDKGELEDFFAENVANYQTDGEGIDATEEMYDDREDYDRDGDGSEMPDEVDHMSEQTYSETEAAFEQEHGIPLDVTGADIPAAAIQLAGSSIAIKADGPGEKDDGTRINAGVWTIPDDELTAMLDNTREQAFERGKVAGRLEQQNIYNSEQRRVVRKRLDNSDQG